MDPHRPHPSASAPALGTVLAVWAHPDDESFVAGGLLAAASDAGSRVVCVTATHGEHGTADPGAWPPSRLARTRTLELAAARAVLGIDEQIWLPYPDGGCDGVPPEQGQAAVAGIIEAVRPDTIVTFGPDGLTGHADHRAVARWTTAAWAAVAPTARLLRAALTADTAARMAEVEPDAGAFYPGYPLVVGPAEVAIRLDLAGETLDRKFAAIRAHATQSAELGARLGEDAMRRWWATESYVEVPAARRPAAAHHRVRPATGAPRRRPTFGPTHERTGGPTGARSSAGLADRPT